MKIELASPPKARSAPCAALVAVAVFAAALGGCRHDFTLERPNLRWHGIGDETSTGSPFGGLEMSTAVVTAIR